MNILYQFDIEILYAKIMEILITVEYDMFGTAAWIFEARVLQLSDGIKEAKSAHTSIAHCLCD